jgi:hypothetical protein
VTDPVLSTYLAARKCLGVNVGATGALLDSLQYFSESVGCGFGSTTSTLLEDTLGFLTDHIGGSYRPAHSARARATLGRWTQTGQTLTFNPYHSVGADQERDLMLAETFWSLPQLTHPDVTHCSTT